MFYENEKHTYLKEEDLLFARNIRPLMCVCVFQERKNPSADYTVARELDVFTGMKMWPVRQTPGDIGDVSLELKIPRP